MLNSIYKIKSSSLAKNSFVYVVTDGINKAIPFLLLPFLTYYLTTEDYGIITNFNVLIQILSVFYFAAAASLPVMFYRMDKKEYSLYLSNMVILNTVVVFLLLTGLILFNRSIYKILNLNLSFQITAIVIVWLSSITNINIALWRCEEKAITFGKYQISQTLLNVLSTIFMVIMLSMAWKGRVFSFLVSSVVFGIISCFIIVKKGYWRFQISGKYLKQMILFSIPLLPHALSFWMKSGADKVLLTNMCGLSENGLYSVAMTLGAIVSMVMVSFSNAYTPYLYKKLKRFDSNEGDISERKQLVRLTYLIMLLMIILVIFGYTISVLIVKYLYNATYINSLNFLPYIMLSQLFYGGYLMFVCYCHYTLKTKILGTITFSLSIIQVMLSYLLIKVMGSVGTAVSGVIISLLTFVFVTKYAMKVYKLPWFYFNKYNI